MSRVEKRRQLLDRLGELMPVPERTDFNLDRWLDAYDEVEAQKHGRFMQIHFQDVDRCVEVFGEYVKNRKALGLDRIPFSPFLSNPIFV